MEWLQSNFRGMAMKPRGSLFVFVSVTALVLLVSTSQDDPLSVQAPVVYGVVGTPLTIVCTVNETVIVAGQVSWKHNGKWLHNQTVRELGRVILKFKSVKHLDSGIYQCGVYDSTGQGNAHKKPIPKAKNVSLLVGGDILGKPVCISFGWPPITTLVWNAVDHHQTLKLAYSAFYCSPPSLINRFCSQPPLGYQKISSCTNVSFVNSGASLQGNEHSSLECNVSSLIKTLFPDLFDPHAQSSGGSVVVFSISLENVFSERYSPISPCRLTSQSSPSALRKCTRPKNVRAVSHERRALSLLWNAPSDMGVFIWILDYIVLYAREGETTNQTLDKIDIDVKELVNISASIRDLEPYSIYHMYIACSLKGSYSPYTRGQFIGPFSGRTLEEEPSGKPEVLSYLSVKVDGNLRNVTVQWKLPDNRTWNGVIRYFLIDYWTADSSSSSPKQIQNGSQVIVLSNVSMTTGHVSELDLHKTYGVTVRMCTIAGCGPPSNVRLIEALKDGGASREERQANINMVIGILTGILLFGLCVLFVSWLWGKRSRRKRLQRKKRTLSEAIGDLNPPQFYGLPHERSKAEVSDDGEHTYASLLNGSGEYVKIRKPKEESVT